MKVGDALAAYRMERKMIVQERRQLYKQKESLERKMNATEGGRERYAEEAATLELSINNVSERFEENLKVLDQLTEQEAAVWNAEVARQQADVMEDAAIELGKLMEVAHRIAKGAIVPATDEKKLLEYSFELYQAAKSMGAIVQMQKKREKYDSMWNDEEEEEQEYDPEGKAYNAETDIGLPESMVEVSADASDTQE
ncbi:MAG: hypothetical protein HDR02_07325 [Lachnospiraceae bacterium]|nr:hypothetical protein [Lachnospiraceae bacterium]